MFCRNCGKEVAEGQTFCPQCGAQLNAFTPVAPATSAPVEKKGTALGIIGLILGFLIPLVGWICGGVAISQGNKTQNGAAVALGIMGVIAGIVGFFLGLWLRVTGLV